MGFFQERFNEQFMLPASQGVALTRHFSRRLSFVLRPVRILVRGFQIYGTGHFHVADVVGFLNEGIYSCAIWRFYRYGVTASADSSPSFALPYGKSGACWICCGAMGQPKVTFDTWLDRSRLTFHESDETVGQPADTSAKTQGLKM